MSPTTTTAPPDQRGGTYERDSTVRALLGYGTLTIYPLRRDRKFTTFGSDEDRDIQILSEHVSRHHGRIERRARGSVLIDERSWNGTHHETKRTWGAGLKPRFEELRVPADGVQLRPGMTFVVGVRPHRFIAIDHEVRKHHPALLDLLGTEDEVRDHPERASPSDFILAADSGGDLLITGHPSCEPAELARIAHKISKRRQQPCIERDQLPTDPEAQRTLVVDEANTATLVLNLLAFEDGDTPAPLDPSLIGKLFTPSYQIRVMVLTRSVELASALLGAAFVQPMMHVALVPLTERRAAIEPMLDRWFAAWGNPMRIADLTPENRRRILAHDWRTFDKLRETAERLDAILRAPTLNQARLALGVARSTFYSWFGNTLRLEDPLVPVERERALVAELAAQPPRTDPDPESPSPEDEDKE